MAKRKPTAVSKFSKGDQVRVKHGLRDTNYPDLPIGGWAGTVSEVHKDGMFTVRWTQETLGKIHPVFRNHCERDGFEFDEYWLGEADLEPDPGGPLDIEQPAKIESKPLSPRDQDDRIGMVFGLTSNDPLPFVDDEWLVAYHGYLSKNFVFPFLADYGSEYGHPERVKVIGLGDSDKAPMIDDEHGILCEARMEGQVVTLPLGELENAKGQPNRRLLDDYCYWLFNWG